MAKLLLLNGPNLNLLGTREPKLYGTESLAQLEARLNQQALATGHELLSQQSNAEHVLLDAISDAAAQEVAFIIINPAALAHTSIALRDALLGVSIPFIEVHISNIYQREAFRQRSYLQDIATGCIVGLGVQGYELALSAAIQYLQSS